MSRQSGVISMSKLVKYDITSVETDAVRYLRAHPFLERLKQCSKHLDRQQVKTLRGQALAGDVAGAEDGLAKLMGWRSR